MTSTTALDRLVRDRHIYQAWTKRFPEFANERKATTVGLTGFDGGRLGELCSIHVHVPSARGEYGPVEDAHMVLDHLVMSYLWEKWAGEGEGET